MKKVLVFSILILAFSGALFAQNANIAQRIIGTWADQDGNTWLFNANGTLTLTMNGSTQEYKFSVTDTKLAFYRNDSLYIRNISISSDGKTIILDYISIESRSQSGILNSVYGGTKGYWLTKK